MSLPSGYRVRPYEPRDQSCVVRLLCARFGGWGARRDPEGFFHWKHADNPFGPSLMSVVEYRGRIVAFRAFLRWSFQNCEGEVSVVRGADAVTDPDHVRRGLWQAMTIADLERLHGQVDMALAHGNFKTQAGYRKLGWQELSSFVPLVTPVQLRRLFWRPTESVTSDVFAPAESRVLRDVLTTATGAAPQSFRLSTAATTDYLTWRYLKLHEPRYRMVITDLADAGFGVTIGWIRLRRGLREFRISSVLATAKGPPVRRKLMASYRRLPVDYIVQLLGPGTRPIRSKSMLERPWPRGRIRLLGTQLRDGVSLPGQASWELTLGDLESVLF